LPQQVSLLIIEYVGQQSQDGATHAIQILLLIGYAWRSKLTPCPN